MHYYKCKFGNQAWEVNSSRTESTDMPGLGMENQQGVPGSEVEDRPVQDSSTRKHRAIDPSVLLARKVTRA